MATDQYSQLIAVLEAERRQNPKLDDNDPSAVTFGDGGTMSATVTLGPAVEDADGQSLPRPVLFDVDGVKRTPQVIGADGTTYMIMYDVGEQSFYAVDAVDLQDKIQPFLNTVDDAIDAGVNPITGADLNASAVDPWSGEAVQAGLNSSYLVSYNGEPHVPVLMNDDGGFNRVLGSGTLQMGEAGYRAFVPLDVARELEVGQRYDQAVTTMAQYEVVDGARQQIPSVVVDERSLQPYKFPATDNSEVLAYQDATRAYGNALGAHPRMSVVLEEGQEIDVSGTIEQRAFPDVAVPYKAPVVEEPVRARRAVQGDEPAVRREAPAVEARPEPREETAPARPAAPAVQAQEASPAVEQQDLTVENFAPYAERLADAGLFGADAVLKEIEEVFGAEGREIGTSISSSAMRGDQFDWRGAIDGGAAAEPEPEVRRPDPVVDNGGFSTSTPVEGEITAQSEIPDMMPMLNSWVDDFMSRYEDDASIAARLPEGNPTREGLMMQAEGYLQKAIDNVASFYPQAVKADGTINIDALPATADRTRFEDLNDAISSRPEGTFDVPNAPVSGGGPSLSPQP